MCYARRDSSACAMPIWLRTSSPLQRRSWSSGGCFAAGVLQHNGGEPLGRLHGQRLLEAGFARVEASASAMNAGSLPETRQHAAFFKAQLAGMTRTAIAEGWLDQSTADAIAEDFDACAERPGAFSARIYCEALGWVND